jgi:hypothetical protein
LVLDGLIKEGLKMSLDLSGFRRLFFEEGKEGLLESLISF